MGKFELAAFAAMRWVEIRVRALADADESLIGVRLMRDSFNPETGRLADPALDSGERVGVMELFAGSIGTFKNPRATDRSITKIRQKHQRSYYSLTS